MYEYKCRLIRVIDGNTVEADIDLGFNIWTKQKIKLYGVTAIGSHSIDKLTMETEAKTLKDIIPREFFVQTLLNKRGKIGRVFGIVIKENDDGSRININEYLISNGTNNESS